MADLPVINPFPNPQTLYGEDKGITYIYSDWVRDGSHPQRDGVFQTQSKYNTVLEYSHFTQGEGKGFGISAMTENAAMKEEYRTDFRYQNKDWRGILGYVKDGINYEGPPPVAEKARSWSEEAKKKHPEAMRKAWATRRQNQTAKAVLKRDKALADAKAAFLLFLP